MKDIVFNKLKTFDKIVFCLGWLSAINLAFWITLLIHNALVYSDTFFNPKSYRVVYVFGWINLVLIALAIFFSILG
jgi:hypothetical protein